MNKKNGLDSTDSYLVARSMWRFYRLCWLVDLGDPDVPLERVKREQQQAQRWKREADRLKAKLRAEQDQGT